MSAPSGRWLFKEEPSNYSFDRLMEDGRTVWAGVRNNLALKHLRNVRKGDLVFFYHTGDEKQVVGTMRAASNPYKDSGETDERFVAIDLEPVARLHRPVTLSEIKGNPKLKGSRPRQNFETIGDAHTKGCLGRDNEAERLRVRGPSASCARLPSESSPSS